MTEETRKKSKAKKKKSGQNKAIVINIYFCTFNYSSMCRHKGEEGLGVKTPFHNVGENGDQFGGVSFGPASKGPST